MKLRLLYLNNHITRGAAYSVTRNEPFELVKKITVAALIGLIGLLGNAASSWAATFTVTSADDADDGACLTAHCSLREAINAANTNSGKDTIAFDIAGPGPHTIRPNPELPSITDPVIIDGYTQLGASPNTNPPELGSNAVLQIELDGSNAGTCPTGLFLSFAGNSLVRGLVINRFTGGPDCGWDQSGILIEPDGNNVIEGNFIGTDVTGTIALGNTFGITPWSAQNTIGGVTPAARNLLSGNEAHGISMQGTRSSRENIVQGNLIGTDITGTLAVPNEQGLFLQGTLTHPANGNIIGGTTAQERNVISGNSAGGITMLGETVDSLIQGNFIGTDVSGNAALGNEDGVHINGASDNLIGGSESGAGNVISANSNRGVFMVNTTGQGRNVVRGNIITLNGGAGIANATFTGLFGTGSAYLANSIAGNGGLGIDLWPEGITPNDPGDIDSGPNFLQNFPVLTNAITDGVLTIEGTLNSTPNTEFTLEFFANTECDPSGHGEGEIVLGSDTVTTDGTGDAAFTVILPHSVPVGQFATATATDPGNNTSEFSACIPIDVIGPPIVAVTIDIKPGNKQNVINPRSKGVIWVAILSDTDPDSLFDPSSQVDIPTVGFGPDGAKATRHKVKDINKDGLGDLLLRFKIQKTGIACGDTDATLTGETFDRVSFTGTDSIKTVGCKPKKCHKKKHNKKHHHGMHHRNHHDDDCDDDEKHHLKDKEHRERHYSKIHDDDHDGDHMKR